LIGVKSKYGSCRGTCMGLINLNNTRKMFIDFMFINYKETPIIGKWVELLAQR
jgi:hypothetical protein